MLMALALVGTVVAAPPEWSHAGGNGGNLGGGGGGGAGGQGGQGGNAHQGQGQGQAQGQLQGQLQGQAQGQGQRQNATARQGQGQRQDNSNNSSFSNSYTADYSDTYSEYVAAAIAPNLATGDCMGSVSAGGSNSVMGFSLGKTYIDENCNSRRDAILLEQLGMHNEALNRLCSQPEMAKVLTNCAPEDKPKEPVVAGRWYDN